jgi:hypothetical protein
VVVQILGGVREVRSKFGNFSNEGRRMVLFIYKCGLDYIIWVVFIWILFMKEIKSKSWMAHEKLVGWREKISLSLSLSFQSFDFFFREMLKISLMTLVK